MGLHPVPETRFENIFFRLILHLVGRHVFSWLRRKLGLCDYSLVKLGKAHERNRELEDGHFYSHLLGAPAALFFLTIK